MKWLITGGAGFIASHLTELLLRDGQAVTAIDDLSTGSIENVERFRTNARYRFVADTITNASLLRELVDDCDVVVHLAAAVGVRLVVEQPVHTIATNVGGTELVLEVAAKKQKRVFLASTSEVYGKGTKVPFQEEDDIVYGASTKSRWSYAASKLVDEFLGLAYWKERKLPVTVGRLFNTVGPRQTGRYGMVIPRFVGQALRGEPITVYGTGRQSRCFGHVADVVSGIRGLCESEKTVGQVYNIGGVGEITVHDLAVKIRDAVGSTSEIVRVPYEQAYETGFEDIERRVPDISKICLAIGYAPVRSIDEILRDVIDFERGREAVAPRSAAGAA